MGKRVFPTIAALLLCLSSVGVAAAATVPAFYSGTDLVSGLQASGQRHEQAQGYILGVFDTMANDKALCPGPGVSAKQVLAVAENRLKSSPEQWDAPAAQFLEVAFITTWPCGHGA